MNRAARTLTDLGCRVLGLVLAGAALGASGWVYVMMERGSCRVSWQDALHFAAAAMGLPSGG